MTFSTIIRRLITAGLGSTFLFLPLLSFAQATPFVITVSPTFVTEKSAQLNGRVNPSQTVDTLQWFEWGISTRPDVYETTHTKVGTGNVLVDVKFVLNGLAPNMQYFYRQIAQNSRGKNVGATISFTTNPLPKTASSPILVETYEATNVTETSALLNGYGSPLGDSTASSWFEWGTTNTFGKQTVVYSFKGISNSTRASITKLQPGTVYYFRAVGDGVGGRVNGGTKTFTTAGVAPLPVAPTTPAPTASKSANKNTTFTRDLMLGAKGDDVKALQVWLNTHGYKIVASGAGSPGMETGAFGALTRAALIKFQKAHGITPATGYFGPKTRAIYLSL